MYTHVSERSGLKAPLIADDVYEIIMKVFVLLEYCKLCGIFVKLSNNIYWCDKKTANEPEKN